MREKERESRGREREKERQIDPIGLKSALPPSPNYFRFYGKNPINRD